MSEWNPTNFPEGIAAAAGIQIGAVSRVAALTFYAVVPVLGAVAANSTAEQMLPVPGVAAGDVVLAVNKPGAQAGLGIVGMRVAGAGSVGVTFANVTAAPVTPASGETYAIVCITPGAA
ncbi:hypothetical protein [Nguyenibacter sp. L1]|uniref:hypothetical protein n=1 Tax=Nguyenibacter sp. L1 TaxID=3049350 RepID=UPI002B480EA7|nr:hypothetical protein [Nguyenibacter sp. L1]WRH89478.1 hypothetical protein QN315_07770 [Nguyenibacter sp. L1]